MGHKGFSLLGKQSRIILKTTPSGKVTYAVKGEPTKSAFWRNHVADCMQNLVAAKEKYKTNLTQAHVREAIASATQTYGRSPPKVTGMSAEGRLAQLRGGAQARYIPRFVETPYQ